MTQRGRFETFFLLSSHCRCTRGCDCGYKHDTALCLINYAAFLLLNSWVLSQAQAGSLPCLPCFFSLLLLFSSPPLPPSSFFLCFSLCVYARTHTHIPLPDSPRCPCPNQGQLKIGTQTTHLFILL